MLRYVCFVWMILPAGVVHSQCWPTTVDSAITVAPGWYPYAAVDEVEQSVMVVYLAGAQIRVKKYDKYGCPMWGGNPAIALDTVQRAWLGFWGNQWGQVISDDSGGVVICWVDFRHSDISDGEPVNDEVYAQRIDVNGQVRYGPNGMRVSGPHTDGYHTIGDMKTDYHGGYFIAYGGDSSHTRTALKRYAMNGELQWPRYFESTGGIDLNATDVWGSSFVSTGGRRYKFDLQGNSLWPGGLPGHIPDNINFDQGGAYSDGEGGAIGVTSWYVAPDYVITVNRANSTGQFVLDTGLDLGFSGSLRCASDNHGGLVVGWKSSGTNIIKLQHIGSTVDSIYHPAAILCDQPSFVSLKGIATNQSYNTIVFWADVRNSPILSFFTQRVDTEGTMLWDSTGFQFYATSNDLFFDSPTTLVYDSKHHGSIMLWMELGATLQIKMKQISGNGIIGEVDSTTLISEDKKPKGGKFILYQNYPNPFNNTTTIKYEIKQQGEVDFRIYNVLGQEVRQFIHSRQFAGVHVIAVDMRGLSSGIYMYCLKTPFGRQTRKMVYIK